LPQLCDIKIYITMKKIQGLINRIFQIYFIQGKFKTQVVMCTTNLDRMSRC
jgi:hypothetical protein